MEFDILEKTVPDALILPFKKQILELCEEFGNSGQSGGSAPYTAGAISSAVKKLMLKEPISDITGIDEEWGDVTEMNGGETLYQNIRCSALFKDNTGVYYLDAISWKGPNGSCWHSNSVHGSDGIRYTSRQYIKEFPFIPKTFYIDINEVEVEPENWEFYVKDMKQLNKVWKYYKNQ